MSAPDFEIFFIPENYVKKKKLNAELVVQIQTIELFLKARRIDESWGAFVFVLARYSYHHPLSILDHRSWNTIQEFINARTNTNSTWSWLTRSVWWTSGGGGGGGGGARRSRTEPSQSWIFNLMKVIWQKYLWQDSPHLMNIPIITKEFLFLLFSASN